MSTVGKLGGAIRRRFAGSKSSPRVRRFRPGVEGLEGRALLSKGLTEFPIVTPGATYDSIDAMTRGPDGNIWFTDNGDVSEVGKITPAGAVTLYPVRGGAGLITPGPDGNLWFASDSGFGKINPAGAVTLFPAHYSTFGLTAGPDGNVWFAGQVLDAIGHRSNDVVGKITPKGQITTYPIPGDFIESQESNAREIRIFGSARLPPSRSFG